jgi:hypothetical protein
MPKRDERAAIQSGRPGLVAAVRSVLNYQNPPVQLTEGLTQISRGPIVAVVSHLGRTRLAKFQ